MSIKQYKIPVLTIAGSDCSGGAGIQADIKTFIAHKTYAMSVITSITAQNTKGVTSISNVPADNVSKQLTAIFTDIFPKAIKIGMVSNAENVTAITSSLKKYKPKNIVLDPVMISKNGFSLMEESSMKNLAKNLIPLATIITPNMYEANQLSGIEVKTIEDMIKAGKKILSFGCKAVLVKGGHLEKSSTDILVTRRSTVVLKSKKLDKKNTHGTGCSLSSAIAANLAHGETLVEAVKKSKAYVYKGIKYSYDIGKGVGPINHFYKR